LRARSGAETISRREGGTTAEVGRRIRRIQGVCGRSMPKLRLEPPGQVERPRLRGAVPRAADAQGGSTRPRATAGAL